MKKFMVWGLFIMSIFGFMGCNSTSQKEVNSDSQWLIVNADDFGCDEKTNNAILKCYTEGIVTSTTAYVNFPESIEMIKEVHELYPDFPVGNPVPVSAYRKIKVPSGGADSAAVKKLIITGMLHPFKYIPMMKKVGVNAFIEQERITRESGIKTPDWFVDVFYENATTDIFLSIIDQLPGGVSEIMCHPGSSENEVEILTNPEVKAYLNEKNIIMKNFNCLEAD